MPALLALALIVSAPPARADSRQLEDILAGLRRAESERQAALREMIYTAQATVIEWEDASRTRVKSETVSLRRVYTRQPDQIHDEYLSMSIDGRTLSPAEIQRELAKQRRAGRRNAEFRSPFSPEMAGKYQFTLLGQQDFEGQAVWSVRFQPSAREQDLFEGVVRVSRDSFQPLHVETAPAIIPGVLEEFALTIRFAPVQDYWLPESFSMQMRLRIRFLVTLADRVLSIEDRYSEYRLNPGIADEVFSGD